MFGIISAFLTTEGLSDSMSRPRKLGITKVGSEVEGSNKVNRSQRRCRVAKRMRVNKGNERMKKIMIAAAVAAVGFGAFAGDCSPTPKDSAWVYAWKFTGKTASGNKAAAKANTSSCAPTDGGKCTYRVKSSLKIQGYTTVCGPTPCADADLGFETAFAESGEVFWMTKPYKAEFVGGVTTEVAHIIGKNKKQVEIGGVANLTENVENSKYTLTYAGFGKYDLKHKRVKSAKGNFAGFLSQPWAYNLKKDLCIQAGYWNCTTLTKLECDGQSIAYGKWSVKYKKSASKKFINGKAPKTPSWVSWLNSSSN